MIKVEKSIVINKPLADVYAFVTSGEHAAEWQGGVESVVNEGPSNTVGSRYTETRKFLGREMNTQLEITDVEANAKWAAKVINGPVPYQVMVTFEPSGAGTKVTTYVEGEPTGFFKLAEGMVSGQLEKSMAEDNERLKALLEGR